MSIKVGHVSISAIVDKYSSEKIKDLDTNPPAEVLREQESIEKHHDDFAKLYSEYLEPQDPSSYHQYYIDEFKKTLPELVTCMEDLDRPDPIIFASAITERRYGGWYSNNGKVYIIESDWQFLSDEELNQMTYGMFNELYERAKSYTEKIKRDEQDIKNIKAKNSQNIKTEADKKVREAMQAVATEESYDLIYDPSEVTIFALNSDDVSDKVSAKVV